MSNMKENLSLGNRLKVKVAEMIADALVNQGSHSVKNLKAVMFSEPKTPIELMREDTE